MVRAIEGHSLQGADVQEAAYVLLPSQMKCLPAMCHGAKKQAVASILDSGLSLAGRQSVMFSVVRIGAAELGEVKDPILMSQPRLCSSTPTSRLVATRLTVAPAEAVVGGVAGHY